MNETRYLISETAKITQVEAHVLRYWEEELGLNIGRNKMGHRYYTEKDIRIFENIKELKKKGLQLRAIKDALEEIEKKEDQKKDPKEDLPRVIVMQPQKFLKDEAGQEKCPAGKNSKDKKTVGKQKPPVKSSADKSEASEKTKEERFGEIMERLIKDIERSEKKEGRYRRLDEAIRKHQQSRKMVAATEENTKRKSKEKKKKK